MSDEMRLVHGFYLNVAKGDGMPGVFLLPVFPERIAKLDAREPCGSSLTLQQDDGSRATFDVTQTAREIDVMIKQCRALDAEG